MPRLYEYLKELLVRFKRDSLFQNSIYLISSTGIMSVLGFVFWIISTRLYSSSQIGYATALISATTLLSSFSMLGFDVALVRYLPKATKPNNIINTAIAMVTLVTIAISIVYILGIGYFGPAFKSLGNTPSYALLFILFMVMVSLNSLASNVFIAYRASKYNFIISTFFALTKLILPIFLVGYGSYGVFFAYTSAVIVSLALSFYFMHRNLAYTAEWSVDGDIARKMARFSITNYFATFMSGLPLLILPTIIVTRLGSAQSAYFYMALTIASLLYTVPQATAQTLLAEGSHSESDIILFVKSAVKIISLLLIPGIVAIMVLGKYVLLVFGQEYSINSYQLLDIMAITGIFLSINLIGSTIMRLRQQLKELILVNLGYLIATILFILYMIKDGILGIGWALMYGQVFVCLEYAILFFIQRKVNNRTKFF